MFTRFNAALAKFCMVVAVIGLLVIVVCVLIQVFGRYVLNDTPTWAEALALVLVLWVTMLGAAVGVRDAGHIGMESLLVWVSEERRRKLEILIHLLSALFGAMMAWQGTILAESVMGYKIPTLGHPRGPQPRAGRGRRRADRAVLHRAHHRAGQARGSDPVMVLTITLAAGEEATPSWR